MIQFQLFLCMTRSTIQYLVSRSQTLPVHGRVWLRETIQYLLTSLLYLVLTQHSVCIFFHIFPIIMHVNNYFSKGIITQIIIIMNYMSVPFLTGMQKQLE